MANGKEIDMEQLVEASDSLSASMDTFLQTELNYIRYLRNRQRYYLGLKHAAVTPTIINNFTKKKEEDRGRGFIPPWWRRRRVPKRKRQPQEQESRVRVPITVLETETATETQQGRVKVPQEQTQTQGQTIPETQTQPDIIGNLVPENVNADIVAQQQTQYDALIDALTKQREQDTNEVRSGTLEKGGFVPEPAMAWQLLDGTALVKRIEFELQNGVGSAGLPATLYERGSVHHGMALNAILAVEGLNIPEALSINNAISVENMARLDVTRPEVENGYTWFDYVQLIGTIALPAVDLGLPFGDAAALASLANMMMKGKVTWAVIRPMIQIFGPKVVQYVKTQLMNLGVKPEMFSMSGNSGSLSTATAAFASGGVITSPTRASAMGLNAFIGEANEAEAIIPMSKMGDAIEAVYREGASILVGSTQALLAKSNSPATTSVLIAANRLEQLVGSERVQIAAPWIPKNLLKGLDKFFFWKKDRKEETNTETENEDTLKTNNFSMDTSSKDFNALVAISSLEAGNEQARVDVAQSIYNRFNDPNQLYGTSIFDIITADGQYQPAFTDPTATSGEGTNTSDAWLNIKDKKTAINAMISYWSKKGVTYTYAEMEALFDSTALALQNQQLIESSRDHVGGRTEFLGSASTLHPLDKGEEAWRGSEQDNRFFEAYGTGGETNEKIKSGWTTNPLLLNSIQPSSNINKEMVIEEPIRQAIKEGNIVEILPQIVQVPVEIPVPIIIDKVEEVMAQMPLFFDPLTKGVG